MMGLSDGRKRFPIGLAVLIQYRSVTASQPATQPPSHVAVAITLNAKASSLTSDVEPGVSVLARDSSETVFLCLVLNREVLSIITRLMRKLTMSGCQPRTLVETFVK